MIILRDSLKDAYVEIRRSSSNSCPVFIFVTPECDSVCALQILTVSASRRACRSLFHPPSSESLSIGSYYLQGDAGGRI